MNLQVCGRSVEVQRHRQEGVKPRYLIDGVNHPGGKPIRFKSLERAERHVRNMRLEKGTGVSDFAA